MRKLVEQSTHESDHEDEKNKPQKDDEKNDSISQTIIMFMIAVVATQVCILTFLFILKDKIIACLTFKYGQIKVSTVPKV